MKRILALLLAAMMVLVSVLYLLSNIASRRKIEALGYKPQ